jgi:16S rRNA (guanine966-N2)-methyltransferase
MDIRPTTDRAREALFSIIGHARLVGKNVLDLFAGTGSFGCEALSRGARHCVFVDCEKKALELIRRNIELIPGGVQQASIIKYDLARGLPPGVCGPGASLRFDLVFADPPYQTELSRKILHALDNCDVLSEKVLVIIEEKKSSTTPDGLRELVRRDTRTYGDTMFAIYTRS